MKSVEMVSFLSILCREVFFTPIIYFTLWRFALSIFSPLLCTRTHFLVCLPMQLLILLYNFYDWAIFGRCCNILAH